MRIHFTRDDLARTYVADAPHPMWEIVLSLHALAAPRPGAAYAAWRSRAAGRLRQGGMAGDVRHRLLPLAPDAAYFPDFLTPASASLGVAESIDAVLATPRRRIRHELALLADRTGAPEWAWRLTDRDTRGRTELGRLLGRYFHHALAPYWPALRDRVAMDRAVRARALHEAGVGGLMAGLGPGIRWRPPVLEIDKRAGDRDLHLSGRGLVLIPSCFCRQRPVALADPELPPTLVYPVRPAHGRLTDADPDTGDPTLDRLLGPTRAAVLRATLTGPNTTEIARRLRVSPATVSQHATVLRESGLIASHRDANSVLHVATPLGLALINQQTPP